MISGASHLPKDSMSDRTDRRLFLEIYNANAAYPGMPYLTSPRKMKRAAVLSANGWLLDAEAKISPNPEQWRAYTVTQAGIDAYNAGLEMTQ